MKYDYKISVIIPVYNAEEYIKKCLDSVLKQTFTDFEVILINDGSKDSSPKICDEYVNHYKNFKVFHQENAGPSAARNKGIDNAQGEYITFIDADDFVDPEYLDSFFILEKEPKNTVVIQGYVRFYKEIGVTRKYTLPLGIHSKDSISELFLSNSLIRFWPFTWGKLYNTVTINTHNVRFDKRIKMGEDLIFFLSYLKCVNTIISTDKSHYQYINNDDSLTYSQSEYKKEILRIDSVKDLIDSLSVKFNFSEELNYFHYGYFSKYLYRAIQSLYLPPTRKVRKERIQTLKETKSYFDFLNHKTPKGTMDKAILFLSKRGWFSLLDFLLDLWHRRHYSEKF